jgi:hypothetical protein
VRVGLHFVPSLRAYFHALRTAEPSNLQPPYSRHPTGSVARPGGHGVVEQFQMLSRGSRALLVPPVANYGPAIYRRSSILFEGTVESH